jgi:hypothetical protein
VSPDSGTDAGGKKPKRVEIRLVIFLLENARFDYVISTETIILHTRALPVVSRAA